ncbi:MAG: hypothetical protein IKU37_09280 [Candidatus Gastranaerophilales bacterium]|nr:hypothetical protein [Candidatus Gastranaerophilales bacterium]
MLKGLKYIEYSSEQEDVYHELSEAKQAKETCATIIARNSLCNYTPFFAFLLQKDSEKFFEMAEKTDLLWNMVQNQHQTYLDFIEDCLSGNSKKTLQLLLKPIIDVDENRCKSALCSCIENTGVDYSELLMAIYQLQPEPEKIFSLPVETKDGHIVNLLTYYVLQKDYKAEEFISYLTNSNILFIRKLLPLDVLHGMKDRKYKLAKDNTDHIEASLRCAIADVERRLGVTVSEKEANLARLVLETFSETQKRIDNLEDNVACMAVDLQDLYFQHRSRDGSFCIGSRQLRPIGE